MNEQTITLDVTKRPAITPVLYIRQGDAHGTTLNAEMYDNGVALSLASYSVRFAMRTPNGSGYYEVDGSASGNVASFVIDETYAGSVSGVTDVAYVEVIDTDTAHTSSGSLRVVVLPSATEDTDPAGAYVNGVDRWLANAQLSLMNMENAANAEVDSAIDRLDDAVENVDGAVSRANAAAAAAEGVVVDAVPLMSKAVHGGAKLGHGLRVSAGALGVQLVDSGSGTGTVQADGDYLHALEVDGKSEQITTTGKNLLDTSSADETNNSNVTFGEDSFTVTRVAAGGYSYVGFYVENPTAGEYFLSFSRTTAAAYAAIVGIVNGTRTTLVGWTTNNNIAITVPSGTSRAIVYLYPDNKSSGGTVGASATYSEVQLEAGSTATAYEPYTGGKASPSPDYPQEVRTVKGINLLPFPYTSSSETRAGITTTVSSDGSVTMVGTATSAYYFSLFGSSSTELPSWLVVGQTYTLSAKATNYVALSFYDSNHAHIERFNLGLSPCTFRVPQGSAYVWIYINIGNGQAINNTFSNIQIERGSTAHDYVPCGALGLKVKGKNLARPQNVADVLDSGLLWTYLGDGKWRAFGAYKGSASGSYSGGSTLSYNLGVLPAGTYTASSFKLRGTGNHLVRVAQNNSYKTASAITSDKVSSATFTADGTSTYYAAIGTDKNSIDGVFGLMIEAGSTATEYAPFLDSVTPIPLNGNVLASLPDGTHDELAIDDAGHAVIDKRVGIKTFDGSESWSLSGAGRRVDYTMSQQDAAVTIGNGTIPNALCDHYIAKTANDTYSDEDAYYKGPCFNVLGAYVFFSNGEGNDMVIDTWKAWLASNPVTILYQLATPQTIDLGYIDMPKLSEGSTIELLATIDPPIDAEWWAIGAGAVHESNVAWGARVDAAVAELAEAIADL